MSDKKSVIPSYIKQGDEAEGTLDRVGTSIPMLVAVQAQSKNKEMKMEAGVGAIVILEGDDAFTTVVASGGAPVAISVLKQFVSYATYRDKDDPREDKFWIKGETLDPQSDIAQKALDKDGRIEPYPKELQTVKGKILSHRHVEKRNFIVKITEGECAGRVVMLTFSKGGWRAGKAFQNLIVRQGAVDVCAIRIGLHTAEDFNPANESWQQIHGCLLDNPWHDEKTYVELVADFATAEETFKGLAAQIGGAPKALPLGS